MLSFPTHIPADRQSGGVCRGTLTLHSKPACLNNAFSYVVLWGHALHIYESLAAHDRGDFPLYIWFIVGASKVMSSSSAKPYHPGDAASSTILRLMTNQGTEVDGTAPTERCRDIWVQALQSGLELSLLHHEYLQQPARALNPPEPPRPGKPARQILSFRPSSASIKYCKSCGTCDPAKLLPSSSSSTSSSASALTGSGGTPTLTPLSQFAKSEGRQDVCVDCSISQGLWYHLQGLVTMYCAYEDEKSTHLAARDGCRNVAAAVAPQPMLESSPVETTTTAGGGSGNSSSTNTEASETTWVNVPSSSSSSSGCSLTSPAATTILLEYIQSTEFLSYCAKSPVLSGHRDALLHGDLAMGEFLERLEEVAAGRTHHNNIQVELKKQAFQMAGSDMGTAMKLLLEQAFCPDESTEVLQCVLDFLLNLCEHDCDQNGGDLQSVAFFWPQLCQIHLRMLPPANAVAATRVDLLEDFLLTICVNYSIHLALEIVWSHTADLEDAMMMPLSSSSGASALSSDVETSGAAIPRRRRFAVLRFLCELESLLFDFEGGWGGGSVAVGKLLKPTPQQVQLLKTAATQLRRLRPRNVSRRRPRRKNAGCRHNNNDDEAEEARRKYTIARNADYFTCHLNFSKRLSDIAEKLRLMEVPERSAALEQELTLLNASGAMGGDPLNRVRQSLLRVVRLPSTEGHVFRSKERTPVLLLMEVVNEEIVDKEDADALALSSSERAPAPTTPPPPPPPPPLPTQVEVENDKELPETSVTSGDVNVAESIDSERRKHTPPNASPTSMILEGAEEGYTVGSPGPKALLRFEDDATDKRSQTPRRDVEILMNSAAIEQLRGIILPDIIMSKATIEEGKSQDDSDPKTPLEKRGSSSKLTGLSTTGSHDSVGDPNQSLAPTGDIRRAVLTTIMMRGIQGNTIAAGAADSVQRSLKELERRRATELLLSDDDVVVVMDKDSGHTTESETDASTRQRLTALALSSSTDEAEMAARPSEEDEVLESIRLILIQNQVAQGQLSPADAAKVLQHTSLSPINGRHKTSSMDFDAEMNMDDLPTIDAGDVDARLVGCGALPPAVLQAMTLWKGGMVSNAELLELVKKDMEFVKHSVLVDTANLDAMKENSAFWARFSFGERWAEKKARIGSSSPQGATPGWDLMGVIVKSNDDLRQEAFVMQLIELCQEAFELAGLELWVSPYRILATGRTTGVIECVRNAMSFDALKKRPGYGKGGLREHLQRMAEFTADPGGAFKAAQQNFVRSLAAYSLISYLFLLKDRHNGNLLLDTAGHVIHIDFGFAFGIAPGGSFSLEMSTPFKLTEEMLDVMGGLRSPLFSEFVTLFCCGFLALQAHCDTFLTVIEITSRRSTFKCFEGRDTEEIVQKMRERLCPDLSKEDTVSFALDLIKQATTSYGTRQYDLYQYLSQGIVA